MEEIVVFDGCNQKHCRDHHLILYIYMINDSDIVTFYSYIFECFKSLYILTSVGSSFFYLVFGK